jgi:hypothetical protein
MTLLVAMTWALAVPVFGACSGSGTSWSCPAGSVAADVNTVISSASDGATVTFDQGNYTWSSTITFSLSKGITLICATGATCTVSVSGVTFGWPSGSSSKLYRISGFTFPSASNYMVWTCPGGGCTGTISQFRFDHNAITDNGTEDTIIQLGENTAKQYIYGVIDHNIVTCVNSCYFLQWINVTSSYDVSPPAPPLGTGNNLFIEDNRITINSLTNLGTGCVDHWGSSAVVYRHNTSMNCRVLSHGVLHGGGPSNFEIYSNTIQETDSNGQGCYRCIHHQGSNTMLVFNNTLSTTGSKSGDPMAFLHYRSGSDNSPYCDGSDARDGNRSPSTTWHGYPCWRQPGRDVTGAYKPIYVWNNKWSDTGAKIDINYDDPWTGTDYSSVQIVANREYYNAVSASAQSSSTSPFNGATGMGFGTLANRPTSCTTSTETAYGRGAAGVGYFATDDGAQGTLYTCSAPNTWTAYYVPYAYPHPLVSGGTSGGGTTPNAPTNLSVAVH